MDEKKQALLVLDMMNEIVRAAASPERHEAAILVLDGVAEITTSTEVFG